MIRYLLSRSGKKMVCQNMVVMAVGLLSMNTTGNTVDGKLSSTKATTTVIHSIDMTKVNTTTLCLV